ncbi:MAG: UDP-N-acetylmuramate dehydrogenase [Bacteroidetes bacterium]|nr:UDP-N-acetylmuramate dehydrogenase [Bacteroidota bacterium]
MQILENVPLKTYNTFGVKCNAKQLVVIDNLPELQSFVKLHWNQYPTKMILGGGSNVLFTSDFDGMILHPQIKGIEVIEENNSEIFVKAMCGEVWDEFVSYCTNHGWGGLENLSQIPGNVGACPIQNIGAYGVEVKETITNVEALDLKSGEIVTFHNDKCEFGYRTSIFKTSSKGEYLIFAVSFRLRKNPVLKTNYADVEKELVKYDRIDVKAVRDAISAIRWRKLPDPLCIGNAGSFFKNPVIAHSLYKEIQEDYPKIPGYAAGEKFIKVPAAWLIENACYKGVREGDVGTSPTQPLVIVNYGDATGVEILHFAARIQKRVKEMFRIELEMEVNII